MPRKSASVVEGRSGCRESHLDGLYYVVSEVGVEGSRVLRRSLAMCCAIACSEHMRVQAILPDRKVRGWLVGLKNTTPCAPGMPESRVSESKDICMLCG